jgi:hypothetical protein
MQHGKWMYYIRTHDDKENIYLGTFNLFFFFIVYLLSYALSNVHHLVYSTANVNPVYSKRLNV